MTTALIFYPTALIIIIFSVLTIFSKKIVYSLISAIVVFMAAGLIFYLLGAEYNAVIQLTIYGLAVPILLAMAIMFTDVRNEKNTIVTGARKFVIITAVLLIAMSVVYLTAIAINLTAIPIFSDANTNLNSFRIFDAITDGFFTSYLIAFELFSILLLAVVAGVSDNAK